MAWHFGCVRLPPTTAPAPFLPSSLNTLTTLLTPPPPSPAAQYIEGFPGPTPPVGYGPAVVPNQTFGCADVDTCDQQYNPTCVPGSANYPINAAITDSIYTARANRCKNNLGYCSPYNYWCCGVKATPCTRNAQVIAIYDGAPPSFNLINEGVPDGITLTYVSAPVYRADFGVKSCGDVDNANDPRNDPSTQLPSLRTFTLRLSCNRSATSGISGLYFGEPSSCQYVAYGSSALACGNLTNTSTACANQTAPSPVPAAAAAASSGVTTVTAAAGAGGFFGGVLVGALGLLAATQCRRAPAFSSPESKPLFSGN